MTAENPASRALARASHLLARLRPSRLGLSLPGGWTALVLASLSFLPSLVPRPALYQGLITGLTAAIGYGLGVLGAWVWRELADRELRHPSPCSVRALLVTAPLLLLAALALGVVWQRESSLLLEMEPEHPAAALVRCWRPSCWPIRSRSCRCSASACSTPLCSAPGSPSPGRRWSRRS
ncbi:MAG: hypothetical protein GX632_05450, partial [Propioniciclava sp.]|nr:hypothetical protein [Propioniciclava sp.]